MKIINIVGARPNFVKIAPILREMDRHSEIQYKLVHTGQHYDEEMSKLFFDELGIPKPDIYLGVGSGSQASQTAEIMKRFEPIVIEEKPDLIVVVGDVNSTVACALVAVKLGVKIAHIEAGLRSFDRNMPEEINRILTDAISDFCFTTEQKAKNNLLKEGVGKEKIFFVGNVMVDTLLQHKEKAKESKILEKLSLEPKKYALLTLHRPSNVDNKETFLSILTALEKIAEEVPVIFFAHPRTQKQIDEFNLSEKFVYFENTEKDDIPAKGIILIGPAGYLDFLNLMNNAKIVLTDSGGIQEETTVLGVPCLTLRENTERPLTIKEGTNTLVGTDSKKILAEANKILSRKTSKSKIPKFWDGKTSQRIVEILKRGN